MSIRIVRLGEPRRPKEGLRLGTVRRPPRGVKKTDYARLNYFDVWLPELSPSPKWVSEVLAGPLSPPLWARKVKSFRREMGEPVPRRLLQLLARLSRQTDFSLGCYCEREDRCHRSILRALLSEEGAKLAPPRGGPRRAVK